MLTKLNGLLAQLKEDSKAASKEMFLEVECLDTTLHDYTGEVTGTTVERVTYEGVPVSANLTKEALTEALSTIGEVVFVTDHRQCKDAVLCKVIVEETNRDRFEKIYPDSKELVIINKTEVYCPTCHRTYVKENAFESIADKDVTAEELMSHDWEGLGEGVKAIKADVSGYTATVTLVGSREEEDCCKYFFY